MASQKTLFVTHGDCLGHKMKSGHPERPERIQAVIDGLESTGVMAGLERAEAPLCMQDAPILKAHSKELWARIKAASPLFGTAEVSAEAIMSRGTLSAIRRAVGGSLLAVERVCAGANPDAFVAIRPPGHHAERSAAMGFCFVNNAAIGAYHALDELGLSRVAIVDIDVHHGNGTEDVVAGDARLFMASTYGAGIYPGNGANPLGSNMSNVALASGTLSQAMRALAKSEVLDALDDFKPELVIVSAGYDAHQDDPLGNQAWSDEDYAWWFAELKGVALRHAGGRLVAVLEGGYDLGVLSRCVPRSIQALRGIGVTK